MRLSFSISGTTLRVVEERMPLGRRYLLPYAPERIEELSAELLSSLERANRARTLSGANLGNLKQAGEELHRILLPPALGARLRGTMGSLSVSIDQELASIPWELLYDGEQFLCRRFDLGRLLCSDWQAQATVWRPLELQAPLKMLVICSDTRGDLDRLDEECNGLVTALDPKRDMLSVRLLRAQDLESVRRSLKSYDIVHFAGHADYDPKEPGGAGWLLPDGKLTAQEIAQLGTARPMPFLVFSNACQTGVEGPWERDRQGRVLGLAGAFLLSGARFYVGTQWELVDGIGARVAAHFYDALGRGANMGAALRAARLRVVEEEGEDALGWATYVLWGDPTWVPLPARAASAAGPERQGGATARLGHRATLPWKRRLGVSRQAGHSSSATGGGSKDAGPSQAQPSLPPWIVAGVMVILILAAAALGAWLFHLFAG
ncbi:MAG: CHAT domain-containing protein [Polyangia bacterium]|nr:CHAT domain-containing protein [Polyangia bacterium]